MSAIEMTERNLTGEGWRAADLAARLAITVRKFKQMRALGVVAAAHGTGKAALYGQLHFDQGRRVLEVMEAKGLSMPAAAEHLRANGNPTVSKLAKTSNRRKAIDASAFGKVKNLGSGVFLVMDLRTQSRDQSGLVVALERCVAIHRAQQRLGRRKETGTSSTVHRVL